MNNAPTQLLVEYRLKVVRPECGQFKGQLVDVRLLRPPDNYQSTGEVGYARAPVDRALWTDLTTGKKTIDVESTTPDSLSLAAIPDIHRLEATSIVECSSDTWKSSKHYQKPARNSTYRSYLRTFLNEFTRLTRHIPTQYLIRLYPTAWVFPCSADVFVGRDGVAISYTAPSRPERIKVEIDQRKILDCLLLPHPAGKAYTSNGPNRICDWGGRKNNIHFVGDGSLFDRSELGNPNFILFDRSHQNFWQNWGVYRGYGDGNSTNKVFEFVEFFGDISHGNFSADKARERAKVYAEKFAVKKITRSDVDGIQAIRTTVDSFEELIKRDTSEGDIETFLDSNAWLLTRSLGYEEYRSQVTVKGELLSRSDASIRPDKFLKRNDGYWDVLDLKRADASLMVGNQNRIKASAGLSEAEAQVETYVRYVAEPEVRKHLRDQFSMKVLHPQGLVVIGRRPAEDKRDEWEDVKNRLAVRAVTYDDILSELKTILAWFEEIIK